MTLLRLIELEYRSGDCFEQIPKGDQAFFVDRDVSELVASDPDANAGERA